MRWLLIVVLAPTALSAADVTVEVQYARLRGYLPPGQVMTRDGNELMRTVREQCALMERRVGHDVPALPADIDYAPQIGTIEYYGTPQRTMTVTRGRQLAWTKGVLCGLHMEEVHRARIDSKEGECSINYITKKATGICDPAGSVARSPTFVVPPDRLDKMTDEQRARVLAVKKRLESKAEAGAFKNPTVTSVGEAKRVGDNTCMTHKVGGGNLELCVVVPQGGLPAYPTMGPVPGLIIEMTNLRDNSVLSAEEVNLHKALIDPFVLPDFALKAVKETPTR